MKSLFFTLLILGAAFAAYDYFGSKPWERIIFTKGPRPKEIQASKPTIPDHIVEDDGPLKMPADANDVLVKIPSLPTNEFVPPEIASIESLTRNWSYIPPQTFPRMVILKQDVQVKMSVGSSILKAGANVQAISAEGSNLQIAPTASSAARGVVPVIQTDLPDQIRLNYGKWKNERIEQSRKAWLSSRTKVATPAKDNSTTANNLGITFDSDGRPAQNTDGSYNLLLAIISTGKVSDVEPNKVSHWGAPELRTVDGKPTWVIQVRYETKTLFGFMEVESYAHIRDRQFIRWIYESGEQVP